MRMDMGVSSGAPSWTTTGFGRIVLDSTVRVAYRGRTDLERKGIRGTQKPIVADIGAPKNQELYCHTEQIRVDI